jgi:hypothetical protein
VRSSRGSWGTMVRTEEEATALMDEVRENGREAVL